MKNAFYFILEALFILEIFKFLFELFDHVKKTASLEHGTIIETGITCKKIQKQPQDVFCKNSFLRNFAKFTGKHLCQDLFFNKVAGLRLTEVNWSCLCFYQHKVLDYLEMVTSNRSECPHQVFNYR